MAAPHIMSETEIEWDSKAHRVFNLSDDPIRKDAHRSTGHVPIQYREHVVAGAQWTEPSFSLWMAGSGVAGTEPPFAALMSACGVDATNAPGVSEIYDCDGQIKTNFVGVTIDISQGDLMKIPCTSCALDLVQTIRPGEPSEMAFTGAGTYTEPTEAALAATLETKAHPVACKGLTVTLALETLVLKEIIIRLNNQTNSPNYDVCGTNGVAVPIVTDQDPTVEMLAVLPAFATANYFSDFTLETMLAFSAAIGTVAGNICTITGDLYLINYELVNVDGISCVRLTGEHSWTEADTKLTWSFT